MFLEFAKKRKFSKTNRSLDFQKKYPQKSAKISSIPKKFLELEIISRISKLSRIRKNLYNFKTFQNYERSFY